MKFAIGFLVTLATAWGGNDVSFVASTGNDANDCTRPTPCRTFQSAALATNINGTVQAIDAADYGVLVVLVPMTFDGAGTGAVLQGVTGDPTGAAINIQSSPGTANVTLRNLVIRPALPNGSASIAFATLGTNTAAVLNLENVRIELAYGEDSIGIYSAPNSATRINLRNVSITGGLIGIQLSSTGSSLPSLTADRVSITNAGTAMVIQDYAVSLRDSVFTGNGAGVTLTSNAAATSAFIERCEMSFNTTGLQVIGGNFSSTARIGDSVITGNTTGVSASGGGTIISFRTNMLAGNVTDGALALTTSLK